MLSDVYEKINNLEHKVSGNEFVLKSCLFCNNNNYKLYINKESGLYHCKVCSETGNLYKLKKELMVEEKETNGIDYLKLHTKLMEGGPVLDYLVVDRHLTEDTIKHFQLGAADDNRLVIPFIINEKAVYWKVRYLEIPEGQSKYKNASKPVRLFNEAILKDKDLKELFIVEGEIDAMSLWQAGHKNVIAVPGAGIKKAEWLKYLDNIGKIYLIYDNDSAGQKGAKAIAQRIGIQKCYNVLLPEGKDINDLVADEEGVITLNKAIEHSEKFRMDGVYDAEELALTLAEEFETKGNQPTYVPDWWYLFGYKFGGYEPGDLIGILAEAKSGKAQPYHSKVKLTNGWCEIGKLRVGDKLASVDGKENLVTGIFDRGIKPIYRITFSDGRSTECCNEHLWRVESSHGISKKNQSGVYSTEQLKEKIKISSHKNRFYIPLCNGDFNDSKITIHPYLLGVLIGNGDLTQSTPKIHQQDEFIKNEIESLIKELDMSVSTITSSGTVEGFRLIKNKKDSSPNPITEQLKDLDLHGKDCFTKFIPDVYLNGSYETRLHLLQGLMDSDGTAEKRGNCYYSTSNYSLAIQVQYLVRSLGGLSKIQTKNPAYSYKGEKLKGKPNYCVTVSISERERIFRLPRKLNRVLGVTKNKKNRLTIKSIEYVGNVHSYCISVSHESKLYITDDFIVTHNSTLALNWAYQHAKKYKEPIAFICYEMGAKRVQRKLSAYLTQADDTFGKSELTPEKVRESIQIWHTDGLTKDDLIIAEANGDVADVFTRIRDIVRIYGIKFLVFDNLHLLTRSEKEAQELNILGKKFKALATELNIPIALILQPHRVKDNNLVTYKNIMGSSGPEKDVDSLVCINRVRILSNMNQEDLINMEDFEEVPLFEPEMYISIDLCRYGAGGRCKLYFDGARSTVKECTEVKPEMKVFSNQVEQI